MASSVFGDKATIPDESALAAALGPAHALWCELRADIGRLFGPVDEEWAYSGKAYGWSLRLKRKSRAIVYLTPLASGMRVSFAFGERAVELARQAELPAHVIELIESAPRYPEGRAVRMAVADDADVRLAVRLAEIKMAS
jgi:hypothetical protein